MKRSNKLYILLGVLAAACAVTFGVVKQEEKKEKIKNSDETILEVPGDSVKTLSWQYESKTLSFHKDEKWMYDEDDAFPVDEEKIGDMLGLFEDFGVAFTIEDVEDYGQYGLDQPQCTVDFATEDQSYEVKIGDYSKMDSQRYVSIGDGNVYLVKVDPLEFFDAELSDVIDNDDIPDFDEISGLQFSGLDTDYSVTYEEDSKNTYCADDVYFTEKDGKTVPLDTSRVKDYVKTVQDLDLTNYVNYKVTEDELNTYGLDAPELTLAIDYTTEASKEKGTEETSGTFKLSVSCDPRDREKAERIEAEAQKKTEKDTEEGMDPSSESEDEDKKEEFRVYARVGESPIVYQITTDEYESLKKASYNDLRHPEVLSADFEDVSQVMVSLDGQDYALTSEKKGKERDWSYQEKEISMDEFQKALESLKADSFTEEKPTGKEEIRVTVALDNENFPEVTMEFYRYDGTSCLAVVDGEPVSLVGRSKVVDLIEAVNAIVLEK